MNPFLPFLIASLIVATAWSIMAPILNQREGRAAGLAGAWAGTVVLAAFWQADAVPWLWDFLKAVLLVWLGAMALLLVAVVAIGRHHAPGRRPLFGCALTSLLIHFAAAAQFLWQAIVSPGGV